jgi:hypothetical protein
MSKRKPNLFIIGAPKCGTTSLWRYLSSHPNIFMADPKEPHYFNFDHAYRGVGGLLGKKWDWDGYLSCFSAASVEHTAVGEASVWYLYSREAIPRIRHECPDAKLIVMLRNPVEMFPSLHEQLVVSGREDVLDVELAWRLQESRRQGRNIPRNCIEPAHLQYRDVCALGTQLKRAMNFAGPDVLSYCFVEALSEDPLKEYRRLLEFIGVAYDGRREFPKVNSAKRLRSRLLDRLSGHLVRVKQFSGIRMNMGLVRRLRNLNLEYRERPALRSEFRSELVQEFVREINILSEVTGRDLSHWLDSEAK